MVKLELTNREAKALSEALDICTDKCPQLRTDELVRMNEILWRIYKKL